MHKTKQPIICDSSLSAAEVLKQNPNHICPQAVIDDQVVFDVSYYSFDDRLHIGQIAAHKDLAKDIQGAFELVLREKFPIQSVIPIADPRYGWDDTSSCADNNSSAFNYRFVRGTKDMSNHAQGHAIDINPKLNPYFPGPRVFPADATYDPKAPGTILADSPLVKYFKNHGWEWGGDWAEDPDYQHFEKLEQRLK